MTSTEIIARYLEKTVIYRGSLCRIERYDPLGSALCDVLVRELEGSDAGREFWVASHSLRLEGGGKMPHRGELRRQADRETVSSLEEIRALHVRDFHKRWPGMEFGKAHFGQMIDRAFEEIKENQ